MPPKRKAGAGARKEATDSESDVPPKKKPCPRPKKNGPYKMPPPLPAGEVLTDYAKHSWVLGIICEDICRAPLNTRGFWATQ